MAPTLTLHQGDAQCDFAEHPMELARRAVIAAAQVEGPEWRAVLLRFASALPHRLPLIAAEPEA